MANRITSDANVFHIPGGYPEFVNNAVIHRPAVRLTAAVFLVYFITRQKRDDTN